MALDGEADEQAGDARAERLKKLSEERRKLYEAAAGNGDVLRRIRAERGRGAAGAADSVGGAAEAPAPDEASWGAVPKPADPRSTFGAPGPRAALRPEPPAGQEAPKPGPAPSADAPPWSRGSAPPWAAGGMPPWSADGFGGADRASGAGGADRASGAGGADRASGAGGADRASGAGGVGVGMPQGGLGAQWVRAWQEAARQAASGAPWAQGGDAFRASGAGAVPPMGGMMWRLFQQAQQAAQGAQGGPWGGAFGGAGPFAVPPWAGGFGRGGFGAAGFGGADPSQGKRAPRPAWTPLVPMKPFGSKRPLFCVHAILGSAFPYQQLAVHLAEQQPLYGIQARGLDGAEDPIDDVEAMARSYVEAIRVVQPKGPYNLGGYSFGGAVALAMAHALRKEGEEVSVLAMFGTGAPLAAASPTMAQAAALAAGYLADLRKLATNAFLAENPWAAREGFPAGADALLSPMQRVAVVNQIAALRYVPRPYAGAIDLFATSDQQALMPMDATFGWSKLCAGPIQTHMVEGSHLSIFQEPQVRALAEKLTRVLDRA